MAQLSRGPWFESSQHILNLCLLSNVLKIRKLKETGNAPFKKAVLPVFKIIAMFVHWPMFLPKGSMIVQSISNMYKILSGSQLFDMS